MGIFKDIGNVFAGGDPLKMFRTGATQAAKKAKAAGELHMDRQNEFMGEMSGYYTPTIEQGQKANEMLSGFYSGNQQPVLDMVQNSPFLSQNINMGEEAVARNRQSTGGWRSGTTQQNLAQNSQNQYQNLVNQQLMGLGMQADYGANAMNNYGNFGSNMINQIGATSGQIANVDVARAANKQQILTGLVDLGTKAFMPV